MFVFPVEKLRSVKSTNRQNGVSGGGVKTRTDLEVVFSTIECLEALVVTYNTLQIIHLYFLHPEELTPSSVRAPSFVSLLTVSQPLCAHIHFYSLLDLDMFNLSEADTPLLRRRETRVFAHV